MTRWGIIITVYISISISNKLCVASSNYRSSNSANSGKSISFSPISNLEASLTASAAHGTIIGIQASYKNSCLSQPCVIMLSRKAHAAYSDSSGSRKESDGALRSSSKFYLDVWNRPGLAPGPVVENSSPSSPSMFHVLSSNGGNVMAMGITGFAPDAHHIVHHAVKSLSQHEYIHGHSHLCSSFAHGATHGATHGTSTTLLKRILVDPISKRLRSAALSENGRPFGVQVLMSDQHSHLYTIDPSGGWKFWGGGAAVIGKDAEVIRRRLLDLLNNRIEQDNQHDQEDNCSTELTLHDALQILIKALSSSGEEETPDNELDLNTLDAVVLLSGKESKCISLSHDYLSSIETLK